MQDITDLYDVATEYERDVLDDLRIRAGWLWKCPECSWHNVPEDTICDGCGEYRRPETTEA